MFSGRFSGEDLTAGTFTLDVARRGSRTAIIDLSDVGIPLTDLRWEEQGQVLAGLTAEDRNVLLTDRDRDQLQGRWSAHGERYGDISVIDLTVPSAMHAELRIDVPRDLVLQASQGLVQPLSAEESDEWQTWLVELGHQTSTTLRIGSPVELPGSIAPPTRYEVDSVHVARRDGIFVQSTINVEGAPGNRPSLELEISESVDVQSVTISGISMAFARRADRPGVVVVSLENMTFEPRFSLRVNAFESVEWGTRRWLPLVRMRDAAETGRTLALRVEPPLRMHSATPEGMIQVGLVSDEASGEVWRFEAREPNARVAVLIDEPRSEVDAAMTIVSDCRPQSGWSAALITIQMESGSRFETSMQLPPDWDLISVSAGDPDSRIAEWRENGQRLTVVWQNPVSPTSPRQLRLFARSETFPANQSVPLLAPRIDQLQDLTVLYQLVHDSRLDVLLLDGDGWRVTELSELSPSLLGYSVVEERLGELTSASISTLSSESNGAQDGAYIRMIERALSPEAMLAQAGSGALTIERYRAADLPESQEPTTPVVNLTLTTLARQSDSGDRVHDAVFEFHRPVPVAELDLQLAENCRLSAIAADGQNVIVFRDGHHVQIPAAVRSLSRLEVTYITSDEPGWLYRQSSVPLPRINFAITSFDWLLQLPRHVRLNNVELGNTLAGQVELSSPRALFGPLSRDEDEGIFQPFSFASWHQLFGGEERRLLEGGDGTALSYQLSLPAGAGEVRFTTWDEMRARSLSWVVMLACLLIGAAARMFQLGWIRQISVVWLAVLFAAVLVVPDAWKMQVGGMFAGSLLSILIPRHWMQRRDVLTSKRVHRAASMAGTVGAGLLILLSANGSWGQGPSIPTTSPAPAIPNTPSQTSIAPLVTGNLVSQPLRLPDYLIRSARYELLQRDPLPKFRGQFEVLVRDGTGEQLIRLPFKRVIFSGSGECLVDGQPQVLIPAVNESSVLVRIGEENGETNTQIPASSETASTPAKWRSHRIELEFSLRREQTLSGEGTLLSAAVPAIHDSEIALPLEFANFPFERRGSRSRVSRPKEDDNSAGDAGPQSEIRDTTLVQLGASGRISSPIELSIPSFDELSSSRVDATAATLLDVSPLRVRGQTRITPGPTGFPAELTLTYPRSTLITSVTGTTVRDWIPLPSRNDGNRFVIRIRPGAAPSPILVSFELPQPAIEGNVLTLPAFKLWNDDSIPHPIGVSLPPGTSASLPAMSGVTPLTLEEWQSRFESTRVRPTLVFLTTQQQPVSLIWSRLSPVRTAVAAETLLVRTTRLDWTASVRLQVAEVATFQHRFRIDPVVRISAVMAGENGIDGPVRFTRERDILTVFVPGGHLGERIFVIRGGVPFTVDSWRPIPSVQLLEAEMPLVSELTIRDETGWSLELDAGGNAALPTATSVVQSAPSPDATSTVVGVFGPEVPHPTRIRATLPPDATRADAVALLLQQEGDWQLTTTFHFSSADVLLRRAVLTIPPELENVQVLNRNLDARQRQEGGQTVLTVQLPDRLSGSATLSVAATLSESFQARLRRTSRTGRGTHLVQLPMIHAQSAQPGSRFVLLEPDSPLAISPAGALRITGSSLPAFVPDEWRDRIRDNELDCYQQLSRDLEIGLKSRMDREMAPTVHLEETTYWPFADGRLRGVTQLWLGATESRFLVIPSPSDVEILNVASASSGPLNWDDDGTELRIPLQESERISAIVIRWRRRETGGELRPFPLGPMTPETRLAGIVHTSEQVVSGLGESRRPPLDLWLLRWQALLNSLDDAPVTLPIDGVMMNNLRTCEQEATAILDSGRTTVTTAQRDLYRSLRETWNRRKAEIFVTGSRELPATPIVVSETLPEMLAEQDSLLEVTTCVPMSADWSGRATSRVLPQNFGRIVFAVLLLAAVTWLVLRFSPQLASAREHAAHHPGAVFILLGLVWWLALSPSVIGLVIILGVWLTSFIRWGLRHSWRAAERILPEPH